MRGWSSISVDGENTCQPNQLNKKSGTKMRTVFALTMVLCLTTISAGQSRQKTRPRTVQRKPPVTEKKPSAPVIGTQVVIINKNGDRITGTLLDLTAYSVKIRSEGLESTIALDTIATLSFGNSIPPGIRTASGPAPGPEFIGDLDSVLNAFRIVAAAAKPGIDYLDYGQQLAELRSQAEKFTTRYGSSESSIESKAAALLASALTDYSWARTIWTLKLGRTSDGTLSEKDSPVVADTLALYPDLRTAAANGPRFSADTLIVGLWQRAAEKAERAKNTSSQ
jgi:hypothetical protein